jgi:hypothetical protein
MKKKVGLLVLFFLFCSSFVFGNYYIDYYFYDQANSPLNHIKIIGWKCNPSSSSTCSQVDFNSPISSQPLPLDSGNSNSIRVEFVAAQSSTDYYIMYAYTDNYRVMWSPRTLSTFSGSPTPHPTNPIVNLQLYKKNYCNATFTPTVYSCAESGLPLSILTDTVLGTQTAAAFLEWGVYTPAELQAWKNVSTTMTVDVRRQGSSTSYTGFPKIDTHNIYAGSNYNFNFLWQTSKSTTAADYTITMTSSVPDAKCNQSNDITITQTMNVHIARSLDGCIARLSNFQMVSTNLNIGQPLTFTASPQNSFQNWSYSSISSCSVDNAFLEREIFFRRHTR